MPNAQNAMPKTLIYDTGYIPNGMNANCADIVFSQIVRLINTADIYKPIPNKGGLIMEKCETRIDYHFHLGKMKSVRFLVTDHWDGVHDSITIHSNDFPVYIHLRLDQLEDLRQACRLAIQERQNKL